MRALPILPLALLLGACDSDSGTGQSVPGLAVHLYGPNGAADPFAGVGWIRMTMTGEGISSPITRTVPYVAGGTGSLEGIPFSVDGAERELVVEGWSDAGGTPGFPVSRGRALSLDVRQGADVQELDVLFARVNSFLPLISTSTKAAQQLQTARVGHTATTTAREIVIAGGGVITNSAATWWNGAGFQSLNNTIEAVDLDTHELGSRSAMLTPRAWHSAVALSSGQVIIAGGYGADGNPTDSAELYNPPGVLGGREMQLPRLAVPRAGHTATLIDAATNLLLFVGGDEQGTWELWDPVSGSAPYGGAKPLPDSLARRHHQATVFYLPGRAEPAVLITGGESASFVHSTAMLYDSVARALIPVSQALPGGARTQHAAVFVPERGYIYVAGGFTDVERTSTLGAIDVFEVATTSFKENNGGFRMRTARGGHQAVLLPGNLVCMAGGIGEEPPGTGARPLGSLEVIAEFIDTANNALRIEVASSWNPNGIGQLPYLPADRIGHRVVALDGMALVVGGAAVEDGTGGFKMVKELSLYNPQ